tara:strand:- start:1419 stop:2066 length:648 start_codon:yes stop_codon:yes gene_type:complete
MIYFNTLLCACPPAAATPDIPTDDCIERMGQVLKVVVQRTNATASTENEIVIATTNPNILATWTTLLSAVDSTKVQTSPTFVSATFEPGEAIEAGGGNDSVGGIPTIVGRNPTAFNSSFEDVKQLVITALKGYECEKNLSVFILTSDGSIWGIADDVTTPTTFKGFKIRSFFVADKTPGGFDQTDKNNFKFSLLPNWSDGLYRVTPSDFNALTQL